MNMFFDLLHSLTNVLRTLFHNMDGVPPDMQQILTRSLDVVHATLSFRSNPSSQPTFPYRRPLHYAANTFDQILQVTPKKVHNAGVRQDQQRGGGPG